MRVACVAPLVGAWIEIDGTSEKLKIGEVAPLVGAWIEIIALIVGAVSSSSLLSWERGLKLCNRT